jgi:hypothetical protein
MSQIGLGGGIISLLSFLWAGVQYLNHRNIRSRCCGVQGEMGIDIDTPKDTQKDTAVVVKPVEVVPV